MMTGPPRPARAPATDGAAPSLAATGAVASTTRPASPVGPGGSRALRLRPAGGAAGGPVVGVGRRVCSTTVVAGFGGVVAGRLVVAWRAICRVWGFGSARFTDRGTFAGSPTGNLRLGWACGPAEEAGRAGQRVGGRQ